MARAAWRRIQQSADAENADENDALERLSDFTSEKVVNDAMSCSENDPDEIDAENPAQNDVSNANAPAEMCSPPLAHVLQKIGENGDPSLAHVFKKIGENGDPPLRSIQDGVNSQLKRHRKAN